MLSDGWKRTMDVAAKDPRSTAYDLALQVETRDYDGRFRASSGYRSPSFRLLKAWLLVESGGPAGAAWTGRVAQIGNPRDAAYGVLKRGEGHTPLVVGGELRRALASQSIDSPQLNLRAGLAYIMVLAVTASRQSVVSPSDPAVQQHTVVKGDSFSRIANVENSTVTDIQASNPVGGKLSVGQPVNYHHATMDTLITGWKAIDEAFLARSYNGGGDPAYMEKLIYVEGLL